MFIRKNLLALSIASLLAFNVQTTEASGTAGSSFTVKSVDVSKTTNKKNKTNTTNTKNTAKKTQTKNSAKKNTMKTNKKAKKTSSQKKQPSISPTQQPTEHQDLNEFNQNVGIKLTQRNTATENDQPIVILTYEVTNRGQDHIQNLNWLSAFTVDNQIFFVQEIQTNLDKAITSKQAENITVVLPFNQLPDNAKSIFATPEIPIGHLTVAKQIDFTNGKQIIVKEE